MQQQLTGVDSTNITHRLSCRADADSCSPAQDDNTAQTRTERETDKQGHGHLNYSNANVTDLFTVVGLRSTKHFALRLMTILKESVDKINSELSTQHKLNAMIQS